MTPDELRDLFGDGELLAMKLLSPPLYYRDWRGVSQRIHTPTADERARLRQEVYVRDGFVCQRCDRKFGAREAYDGIKNVAGLTLAHIIDYRDGGPYIAINLRAECTRCNQGTAFMTPKGTPPRVEGRGDGAFGQPPAGAMSAMKVSIGPAAIADIEHNRARYAELERLRQGLANTYNETRYR